MSGNSFDMTVNPLPLPELLQGLDYPVSKEDLIRWAQETGAGTETLLRLRSLPVERFDSPDEISGALGELA